MRRHRGPPALSTGGSITKDEGPPTTRTGRERELTSLYATARSLTALGELEDVLDSIVRHAHELIGTDFTYLSLLGEGGELCLTASEGTISADFRAGRIPPGTGLGGKVIDSRAAYWVSNYAEALDLRHDPVFDTLVGQEGMVALLGVPLLVGEEAIGVLFAADRTERTFRADEIALLSAFAGHAAVVLDNARLYDESRAALARLQEAYLTIEGQVAVMERAQSVHEALTGVVLSGGGPQDVALQLAEQMGGTVTIRDRDGAPVARARWDGLGADDDEDADGSRDGQLVADVIERAVRSGRCSMVTDSRGGSHSAAAIRAGDSLLGTVAWSQDGEPGPFDVRTLERATHLVGLLILKENAVADAAERLSGELLTDLLVAGPTASPTQRARTRSRGIDVDALNVVVVADCPTVPNDEIARRLRAIAHERGGLAGEHQSRATMLVPAADADACVREAHQRLRRELGQPVTVIGERVRDHDWARAFSRTSRCVTVADALGALDVGSLTDQFALYALLLDVDRSHELDRFVAESIGPLVEYDRKRSTELLATLDAYFDHGGNLRSTAAGLHVHLNTLHKRLDRIASVLGFDWRATDDLQLRLAVRLQVLRLRLSDPERSR